MAVYNQNLNRALFCLTLTPANEISLVDSSKKTLSKCCVDPLRPPPFLKWDEKAGLRRDAIRSQRLTRSRRNGKETGYEED